MDDSTRFASELEALRAKMGESISRAEQVIFDAAIAAATTRAANRFIEIVIAEQMRLADTVAGFLPPPPPPPIPQAQPYANGYDHFYGDPMPRMFQQAAE